MVGVKPGEAMFKSNRALCGLVAAGSASAMLFAGCSNSIKDVTAELEPVARAQQIHHEPPLVEPLGVEKNGIRVVYPHDQSRIAAPSTFINGAVAPGSSLTVNGEAVRVNPQGFFSHVVPLKVGTNPFTLVKDGDSSATFSFSVTRPAPPKPVPASPAQILKSSLEPKQDIGAQTGDLIQFAMRGSPGSAAFVKIGNRTVKLSAAGTGKVNVGLDTTFGVQFQRSPAGVKDFYTGFYRVAATDNWMKIRPEFILTKGAVTVREKAPATITILSQPYVATTTEDDTIVRVGPGAGRTTPWAQGVRALVDGFVGNSYRLEVAPGKHLWIEKEALAIEQVAGEPPTANVRTINIENEGNGGARIVVPLNQRLPYEVRQEVGPGNKLILKIYGATADTDWITEPATSSHAVEQAGQSRPQGSVVNNDRNRNPVTYVTWQQVSDRVYQVTANLSQKQQWGYWVDFDGSNLVLHVKGAPNVALSENSLRGLRICLDPGHGGREPGATGLSGIKEATINLAITKRLERILRQQGADVIMARTGDVDVSLGERVAAAVAANADLLLSVHNNSLPDGRNPWNEHGASSYYYHPQSRLFAADVREGLVAETGFRDYNTRWQNLALCRPTRMPAALIEVGFVINPDEYAFLLSEQGQERAARGIANGIRSFLTRALSAPAPSAANTQ